MRWSDPAVVTAEQMLNVSDMENTAPLAALETFGVGPSRRPPHRSCPDGHVTVPRHDLTAVVLP